MKRQFIFGKHLIEYNLVFKNIKYLRINISHDLNIEVNAPFKTIEKEVEKFIEKKASWIIRTLDYFEQFHPLSSPKEYISGETHYYLGRQYRLKVIKDEKDEVKLKSGYFFVRSKNKSKENVKKNLDQWYNLRAKRKFKELLEKWYKKLAKYGIPKPDIKMRRMKKRWGSCNIEKKTILLNTFLITRSTYAIEYIIVHELSHLKYPGHNKKFYAFLDIVLPDWKVRRKKLES
ncbi:M48 family metallopeptidase [bacterium]|nr:M48 family metallopeptidase [bacterium]